MRKRRKKIWIAAACAVILIVLVVLLLQSRFVKQKILSSLQSSLQRGQGIQLIVESFDYSLLKLQFFLKGIQLQKWDKSDRRPVFRAEEVRVNIPLSLVLKRRLRIQDIEIINPEILIHIDQDGNSNLPFQTGKKKSSRAQTGIPDFLIEHFEVKNAQLKLIDKRNNLEFGLSEIGIKGDGQDFGMHSFLLEMRRTGYVNYHSRSFPLEKWIIQAELDREGLNVEKLFLVLAKNEIEFSGRIVDFSSLFFEGSMQGHLDAADLRSLIAADNFFSGNVEFRSNVKGPLKEPEAWVVLNSGDLSFKKIENIGINAELYWKDRTLEVLSLDLRKEKGEIQGQGTLHPLRWDAGNHLNLDWKNLDVEPFMDFIRNPLLLSAETTGSLNVSWDGFSWDAFAGECDVQFASKENGEHPDEGTPLRGRIIAKADSGRLDITLLDVSILDADLKAKFQLSSDELSGDFGLEVQSIGKMMPLVLAFARNLDEKDVQRLGLDGFASISATLGGNLREPKIRLDLEGKNLQVLKTKELRIDGVALYDLRSLQIESLLIEDGEGRIEMSGSYPLKPAGGNMRIDIEGEALSIEKTMEFFETGVKAKGLVQVKAKIEGGTGAPRVESKWLISGASLYEENFDGIDLEANYQNSKIIFDSLRVVKSTGTLEASGFYDLKRNEFGIRLSGKSFPLDGLKTAENLDRIKAELDVDFEASGNFDDPRFKTKGTIRRFSIGNRDLSDWQFKAQSEGNEVRFSVEAPAFSGSIDGTVSLKSPYVLKIDLAINKMHLEEFRERSLLFKGLDFSGFATADIRMNMNLRDPRKSLRGEARIEQIQIESGDHLIQNDGPLLLFFESETIRAERLLLVGGGTRIKAEGSLPLDIPSSSKIILSAEVNLSLLNDFFPVEDCKGFLKMESQLLGSLADLEVAAVIDLSDVRFQSSRFPLVVEDIQAHLEIEKNLLRVNSFSGRMTETRFGLEGKIPFDSLPFRLPAEFHVFEEREAKLTLHLENWDPSSLMALIPNQMFRQLKGIISGRFDLEGKKLQLADLSGKALLETFELNVSGVSFKQDAPSQISLKRGKLSIETLSLREGENRLNISGIVDLTGGENLDLSLDGRLDMSLLGVFLQEGIFSGKTRFQIHVAPSLRSPEIQGSLDIQDGRYQRISPRVLLEQVNGEIKFKGNQVETEKIQGVLNGGKTIINGKIGLHGLTIHSAEIGLRNENSLFDYPKGLHSQVSGDLKFLFDEKDHQIAGTITVLDARYRDDFRVGTAVFNLLRKGSIRETLREPNPFLRNLSFSVNIDIANNFIIDNNMAKAEISADLMLIGTPYYPSLSGRASVVEEGEIYFNQNTFLIEQGTVDFINPARIEPDLNLSARTKVLEYDIRLIAQGTPDKFSASLVSDPPLSEPNIISLLVMGRTLESASAHVLSVAGSTALSYLNNAVSGRIEQATARALGLESVRIDAGLVSTEENPGARITVGQHLSREIELVFSQDLKDTRNQMWMVNYNPFKSFNIQGIKRDNNEFNLALRHEIQFGLNVVPQPVPAEKLQKKDLVLGDIQTDGDLSIPESTIYQSLKLKKGKKIDFARFHEALERIRNLYRKNDYLSFSLSAKREEANGRLNIALQIDSGPKIFLEFEGASIPKKMKRDIVNTWIGSSFGQLALEDIEQRIRAHFMEKRYYQVKVRAGERKGERGERILVFKILKGRRYDKPKISIRGNRAISEKIIEAHLQKSGLMSSAFDRPIEWVKSIEDLYMRHGYLRPKVQLSTVHLKREERKAFVEVSIEEGVRFKVGNVDIEGLRLFPVDHILGDIGIRPGDIVSPEKFNQVDHTIQGLYVQEGFNDVRVQSDVQVDVDKGTVDLKISIRENLREIITEIRIEGNRLTDEKIIRRELMLEVGDVVDLRVINETRKRLYDLGIFERVTIDITPPAQEEKNPAEGIKEPVNREKYYQVVIGVVELKPYRLRYGFQYDTESSFGVLANLVNRNFLGKSDLLGGSLRLNSNERNARVFFRSPYFFTKKLNTEFFLFYNRVTKPAFTLDRTGFTLQQQVKIKNSNVISYDYSFEKIDTLYPLFEGIKDVDTADRIGTLNAAFTHDTRDDILDATRGVFLSQNIRYAPGFLGSKTPFIRYFGQYNAYQKLSDFLIYAASIRLGLGRGLNKDLPASERFFAGGGTTVRGFKKDELGPRDPSIDLPLGGDAVFILNQELRFPILKKFGGVVFLDLGNVYPKISDFSFSDVRKTAGFGLRLHTPYVLVRFDWGFKLDRRAGESLSRIFFSIGQAF